VSDTEIWFTYLDGIYIYRCLIKHPDFEDKKRELFELGI